MRLLNLTVRNFRGFGPSVDSINLDADLVLLYGPNGHGKTSLAEAIEWLFYGTTKRRLRGDDFSKAEYANTFANAHGGAPTEVALHVRLGGEEVTLSRRLGAKETSATFIDGDPGDFSSIGIVALDAFYPVVAQHGLQTFVHAKPKDRRDAICAALGLEELTALKSALESARGSFQRTPPQSVIEARKRLAALSADLEKVAATTALAQRWAATPVSVDVNADEKALISAAAELCGRAGATKEEALRFLREKRAEAGKAIFDVTPIAPGEGHQACRTTAIEKLAAIESATVRVDDAVAILAGATAASFSAALLAFWNEGLSLAVDGDDCPMCEAPTLGEARKAELRARLLASAGTLAASEALDSQIQGWQAAFGASVAAVAALGLRGLDTQGRDLLSRLLSDHEELSGYFIAHDAFVAAQRALGERLRENKDLGLATKERATNPEGLPTLIQERSAARQALTSAALHFDSTLGAYEGAWAKIVETVEAKIAANDAVARIDAVGKALRADSDIKLLSRYAEILEETQGLIRSVESIAQTKQEALLQSRGLEVTGMYKLLNQGAAVGFETMEPATDALKLHATSFGTRMPAAANLSECQLNCLGLAVWLMRATTKSSPFGFILLDDPVQAMDDDHAEAFIANIVPHLLDQHGKQVVVLSHVKNVTEKLRALNMQRSVRLYHYENYLQGGPVIVHQARLQQALAEITGAAGGNDANREYAVDRLRVLAEHFVRELHLQKTGQVAPTSYDTANSGELLRLFRAIPGTEQAEHAGMKDTVHFCDPAHHTQVGYAVPLKSNIQPHIDRMKGLMAKYGLIT